MTVFVYFFLFFIFLYNNDIVKLSVGLNLAILNTGWKIRCSRPASPFELWLSLPCGQIVAQGTFDW